ncbi:acyl-CoA synthetase (AMP-forming)/AMP-acid ligase II [Anaerobacterium chartisolvens]|uniref:Acyl-CoA synthetase (AMP-forming)/AMP-acid ligase II n=1 Tax=Anaerobacterium chartisolvens TaxID=1297424 RepID=A0A369B6U8_9FIRM|nr:class I adenylate-forming enzyme family protein [Anaerobacterium chartisolvens]RCX16338.1 acyl-CoA synthetase (AMP-forming)/AMP-acid ligase II [Anaerobacterium chartisolvens]
MQKDPRFKAFHGMCNGEQTFKAAYESIYGSSPERICTRYDENGEIIELSFRQYDEVTRRTAGHLKALLKDVPAGSWVAFKHDTTPYWLSVFWGLMMAGYNVLLVDFKHNDELIGHFMKESGALAIVCSQKDKSMLPFKIIAYEDATEAGANYYEDTDFNWADRIALCTSGTTSTSKIFVYDGKAFIKQLQSSKLLCLKFDPFVSRKGDRVLAMLPAHHIFGLIVTLFALTWGDTVVYLRDKAPSTILDTCRRHEISWLPSVPLFWNNVAKRIMLKARQSGKLPKLESALKASLLIQKVFGMSGARFVKKFLFKNQLDSLFGTSLRIGISGGGHVSSETIRLLNGLGYCFMNGYGSTEVGLTSTCNEYDMDKRLSGSIGSAIANLEYAVLVSDGEEGTEEIKRSGTGELVIKGGMLHIGKLKGGEFVQPERYMGVWYKSGDIAYIDKSGLAWIRSRVKDVIITESGENVYPDEIEEYFQGLPHCEGVYAVGLKGKEGNDIIALVLKPSVDSGDREAIQKIALEFNAINKQLPVFKRVGRVIVSNQEIPMANGIKIKRLKLKEIIENGSFKCSQLNLKTGELEPRCE